MLALKRSFSKFHFFILQVKFLVKTDNTNVKAHIFNKLPSTPKYKHRHRWQQYFQEHQFDIEHIKGINYYLADFLSKEANQQDGVNLHELFLLLWVLERGLREYQNLELSFEFMLLD